MALRQQPRRQPDPAYRPARACASRAASRSRASHQRLVLTNGGRLLVASLIAGNAVVGIDTATSREIARLPVGRRPEAVLVDSRAPARLRGGAGGRQGRGVLAHRLEGDPRDPHQRSPRFDVARSQRRRPATTRWATDIDGDATPFFGADRLARLAPAERAAWTRYLAAASQRRTADQALLGAELRAAGKARMAPAPYRKEFRLTPSMTPAWLAGDEGRRRDRHDDLVPDAVGRLVQARRRLRPAAQIGRELLLRERRLALHRHARQRLDHRADPLRRRRRPPRPARRRRARRSPGGSSTCWMRSSRMAAGRRSIHCRAATTTRSPSTTTRS